MLHITHGLVGTCGFHATYTHVYMCVCHQVLAFVPACYLDYEYVANKKRMLKVFLLFTRAIRDTRAIIAGACFFTSS